jgi:2-amino-4-hydroxy-6-hydroxymethyldihydropteridine diphosphokinase
MFTPVYLGLGSNLGDRESYLESGIKALSSHEAIEVVSVSDFINTKAVSEFDQPDFLNAALGITTILSARELLAFTQSIEKEYGRTSKGTYDPRTLDIDILLYGNDVISDDDFVVPHPLMHERAFVLDPLAQIAPHVSHPILQATIDDLREMLGERVR